MKLELGKSYGTNSKIIYDVARQDYNWDYAVTTTKGFKPILYHEQVTPENYSVWFICYSNLAPGRVEKWENYVSQDGEIIEETWYATDWALYHDDSKRVVFVRSLYDSFGTRTLYEYYFWGIFKPMEVREETDKNGQKKWVKRYERISTVYPEK